MFTSSLPQRTQSMRESIASFLIPSRRRVQIDSPLLSSLLPDRDLASEDRIVAVEQ